MSLSSTYKPSPLSFGSPRTSPFRRPESPSPSSPSTTIRPTTPTASPTKAQTPIISPSKLLNATTPTSDNVSWTPRGLTASIPQREPPTSPTRGANAMVKSTSMMMGGKSMNGDALTKLPPAQVREMREAFQILDRDSDGQVNRDDVADMLTSLGQDPTPSTTSTFFPPSTSQTLTLPTYLHTLSTLLAPLSSSSELLAAFAAFDDDDSGQIDVRELRDALLHTSPEAGERAMSEREVEQVMGQFVGKRAFGKKSLGMSKERGEVFKYGEFVGSVMGGGEPTGGKEGDGDQK